MKYSILINGEGEARTGKKEGADLALAEFLRLLQGTGHVIEHASFKSDGATTTLMGAHARHPGVPATGDAPAMGGDGNLKEPMDRQLLGVLSDVRTMLAKLPQAVVEAVNEKLKAAAKAPKKEKGAGPEKPAGSTLEQAIIADKAALLSGGTSEAEGPHGILIGLESDDVTAAPLDVLEHELKTYGKSSLAIEINDTSRTEKRALEMMAEVAGLVHATFHFIGRAADGSTGQLCMANLKPEKPAESAEGGEA